MNIVPLYGIPLVDTVKTTICPDTFWKLAELDEIHDWVNDAFASIILWHQDKLNRNAIMLCFMGVSKQKLVCKLYSVQSKNFIQRSEGWKSK